MWKSVLDDTHNMWKVENIISYATYISFFPSARKCSYLLPKFQEYVSSYPRYWLLFWLFLNLLIRFSANVNVKFSRPADQHAFDNNLARNLVDEPLDVIVENLANDVLPPSEKSCPHLSSFVILWKNPSTF